MANPGAGGGCGPCIRLKVVGRGLGYRIMESSTVPCVSRGIPACLPADALAFNVLLIVPAGLQEKMLALGSGSVNVVGCFY